MRGMCRKGMPCNKNSLQVCVEAFPRNGLQLLVLQTPTRGLYSTQQSCHRQKMKSCSCHEGMYLKRMLEGLVIQDAVLLIT